MREFGKSAYQIHRYLVSALTKKYSVGLICLRKRVEQDPMW